MRPDALSWPPARLVDSEEDYAAYADWYWAWEVDRDAQKGDAAFYVELAKDTGGPVLEIGTGTGQLADAIAAAGLRVVGVDSCKEMIEAGAWRQRRFEARVADARTLSLGERFRVIVIPFTAFGHFASDEDRGTVLQRVCEHLAEGGVLAIDERAPERIQSDLGAADRLTCRREVPWSRARLHPCASRALAGLDIPDTATVEIWRNTRWDGRTKSRVGWDFIDIVDKGSTPPSVEACASVAAWARANRVVCRKPRQNGGAFWYMI